MLRFKLFKIPVGVDWFFWLTCVLLGGGIYAKTPDDWIQVALWTAVVFVSILIHELGHAFAGRRFGSRPLIRLHGLGGVTVFPEASFSRREGIIVSAAGPAAGLLLGAVVFLFASQFSTNLHALNILAGYALYVNVFWTLVNLLPIQPLDGGQILRDLLGPTRIRLTCWVGAVAASGLALWAVTQGLYILAVLLGVLAFHNFSRVPIQGGVVTQR